MKAIKNTNIYLKEVKNLKKAFVILLALGMLFAMTSIALAKGNITPKTYEKLVTGSTVTGNTTGGNGDYKEYIQGSNTDAKFDNPNTSLTLNNYAPSGTDSNTSTHIQGTWNSPYTVGIDGYNYNDPQDYVTNGNMVDLYGQTVTLNVPNPAKMMEANPFNPSSTIPMTVSQSYPQLNFTSGPHGGYLTSTHKCRECHAVHRAAGKFKLLRSDTRFEACDWCHGTGAGSGFNIQMDNDEGYTQEYNVGHTMGFGISSGKWKAPDDTYPAFTPNYWMGGFSCFDCHSPHANPSRLLGYDDQGVAIPSMVNLSTGEVYNLGNPGHDMVGAVDANGNSLGGEKYAPAGTFVPALGMSAPKAKPYYLAGSWLLIENPDREIASTTYTPDYSDTYTHQDGKVFQYSILTYDPMGGMMGPSYSSRPSYPRDTDVQWPNPFTGNTTNFTPFAEDPESTITPGMEIPDTIWAPLNEYNLTGTKYPVNKAPVNWDDPIGSASATDIDQANDMLNAVRTGVGADGIPNNGDEVPALGDLDGSGLIDGTEMPYMFPPANGDYGFNVRNPYCRSLIVDEFCTDCHDGNAGFHTVQAPLFSEDRALRNLNTTTDNWRSNYDLAYGHDTNVRH